MRHRALRELLYTARFTIVGTVATLLHLAVVWLLIEWLQLPPLSANSLAFFAAFAVSFIGHYYWTFRRTNSPQAAIQRFFLVSITAFSVNTVVLAALISAGLFAPSTAAVFVAFIMPAATFLGSRLWAFRPE
jgi:putative flippase GtrA